MPMTEASAGSHLVSSQADVVPILVLVWMGKGHAGGVFLGEAQAATPVLASCEPGLWHLTVS